MRTMARLCAVWTLAVLCGATTLAAGGKKSAAPEGQVIDSGVFSLYKDGRVVSRESFVIRQLDGASQTEAALSLGDGKPAQKYSMRLASSGQVIDYQWSAQQNGRPVTATARPSTSEKCLNCMEQTTVIAGSEPERKSYMLPATAALLDEYFVSQRQLLIWRYLANSCKSVEGQLNCAFAPEAFGAVSPQLRTSFQVTVSYVGDEPIHYKDADLKLHHFRLATSGGSWSLWLDDHHHILRVVIEDTGAEILRD